MTQTLRGKTALVTGASKGIGAAIARRLAGAGATVVVNYAKDKAAAEAVISAIESDGGQAWAFKGDISQPEDIAGLFTEIAKRHDRLDVLVNNAGIYEGAGVEDITAEHVQRLFAVNVLGLLLVTKAAVPMFGTDGGSIINIGAMAGRTGFPGMMAYAGTKGAVDAITLSLAKELGHRKIRVNAVNPGAIETEGVAEAGLLEGNRDGIVATTPLGRVGTPDDIAGIVAFLAAEESFWIDGQLIFAAGGQTA